MPSICGRRLGVHFQLGQHKQRGVKTFERQAGRNHILTADVLVIIHDNENSFLWMPESSSLFSFVHFLLYFCSSFLCLGMNFLCFKLLFWFCHQFLAHQILMWELNLLNEMCSSFFFLFFVQLAVWCDSLSPKGGAALLQAAAGKQPFSSAHSHCTVTHRQVWRLWVV